MKGINRNNKGFSLVELAIGLAIITVLILAISLSSGIRDNAKIQSASQSVNTLRLAAENYLASGNLNYSALSIANLKSANLLPNSFTGTGANPWGGNYTIVPNASNNARVDIALSGVPSAAEGTRLTNGFINSSSNASYDATAKTWTVTF